MLKKNQNRASYIYENYSNLYKKKLIFLVFFIYLQSFLKTKLSIHKY